VSKADFNAEEWETVLQGPPSAGLVVIAADHGGTVRESVSIAKAYVEARRSPGESALIDEIVASQPAVRPVPASSSEELRERCLATVREAVATVRAKAPEEVERYRAFVRDVAARAAEAAKEGGFLGVGGERVSEAERRALADIDAALADPAG
jgi:hypothetical protein